MRQLKNDMKYDNNDIKISGNDVTYKKLTNKNEIGENDTSLLKNESE